MSSGNHFEAFAKGMETAAARKYPSEMELQQAAMREFKEFFDATEKWDQIVKEKWPSASVHYKFGQYDSSNSAIQIFLKANKPDGRSASVDAWIMDKAFLMQSGNFNNKFGMRKTPRWDSNEMDDLLPKMTRWLLEFFQAA